MNKVPTAQIKLSLSVQVKYKSDTLAPELMPSVILKPFRYSLHMAPKSLLVDFGNNKDIVGEAINAVQPFATNV